MSSLIALTGWDSLQWVADGVTALGNALSGAYKIVKGILENKWLSTLATAGGWVAEGLVALFTGGGAQALMVALGAAANGIGDKIVKTFDLAVTGSILTNGISAWVSDQQMQIDRCNSMSLAQIYQQAC